MSIEDINNAAAAQNALTARINGFMDAADAGIAARQDAYDALAHNLEGVVRAQMGFGGTVDPDAVAPDPIDGGTFRSIGALIEAAPAGAVVRVRLRAGKTHPVEADIALEGRRVAIYPTGEGAAEGAAPVLRFGAYASDTHNSLYGFAPGNRDGQVSIRGCEIRLPTEKADAALPWSVHRALCVPHAPQRHRLGLRECTVTGAQGLSLVSANGGGLAELRLHTVVLDGAIYGVSNAASGCALICHNILTLQNGAALRDGGTLGVNILQT